MTYKICMYADMNTFILNEILVTVHATMGPI